MPDEPVPDAPIPDTAPVEQSQPAPEPAPEPVLAPQDLPPTPELAPAEANSVSELAPVAAPAEPPAPPPQVQTPQPSAPPHTSVRDPFVQARSAIQDRKRKKLDRILATLAASGLITNDHVEKLLHVSDATATRYLSQLEKEGKIQQVGTTGTAVKYQRLI
jgi:hypothetical protein